MAELLLLEPNKVLGDQYKSGLDGAGNNCRLVSTAQDAVLAIDKVVPDLVILEIFLAKHSGVEFLYELRSYPEWKNIPVIILSRVNFNESGLDRKSLENLGVGQYIYKPETSPTKLKDKVLSLINQPSHK